MNEKAGDKVKVVCDNEEFSGTLIDSKKDVLVLKLENGYNIGLERGKIKSVEVLEKGEGVSIKYSDDSVKEKKGLPRISILHTGGTIASKVDYRTGGVFSSFDPKDLLGLFPELSDIANFDSRLISNMLSDDLRFSHFSVIAKAVEEEIKKGVDGIIIGIGTDNLAVCSAALSFAVKNSSVPIIFVGAQRSSDRGSSDAAMNLICAAEFIVQSDFSGVAICFHDYSSDENCVILPSCKTKKLHSSRRDAFKAVNDSAIAKINFKSKKIEFLKKDYSKKDKNKSKELLVKPDFEEKVGLLKAHVNMFSEQILVFKGYKGLIIEGTGLGHIPGQSETVDGQENEKVFSALKKVIDSGCVVVMTTNCIFGRVNMNVYSRGRDLLKIGVISGEDMLSETALVKLSWLLANNSGDSVKELVRTNLCGDINLEIGEKEFL